MGYDADSVGKKSKNVDLFNVFERLFEVVLDIHAELYPHLDTKWLYYTYEYHKGKLERGYDSGITLSIERFNNIIDSHMWKRN